MAKSGLLLFGVARHPLAFYLPWRDFSPSTHHGELTFALFLCFTSLLGVLSSVPAEMGKVR